MSKYVGITIGPIVKTIQETTKPAGLWFASSFFSDLTRRICLEISKIDGNEILSPYFDKKDSFEDGVGKYHDRIIYRTEHYEKEKLDALLEKVKRDAYENFSTGNTSISEENKRREEEYLTEYLQIKYVVLDESDIEGTNSVLALSPYLDAMELINTIPREQEKSPFERIFKGEDSNQLIEQSPIFKEIDKNNNQFFEKTSQKKIRTIEEIACGNKESTNLLCEKYFATVSADGDGMGAFLKGLTCDADVQKFSKACLDYDKEAARIIGDFGGMTIYAGGDDLLFLAPVKNNNKMITTICKEINEKFQEMIKNAFAGRNDVIEKMPTISFGIAVRYNKYPLYEALANSRNYLEYVKTKTNKNAIAISVEKHSGQSVGVIIPNKSVDIANQILEYNTEEVMTQQLLYTLENMKLLLQVLDQQGLSEEAYWNSWKNFFDNANQKIAEKYHMDMCKLYYQHFSKEGQNANISSIADRKDQLLAFTMMLRIEKFLKAEGDK